ncbi:hypothetical protein WJX81_005644 [Elliptochloris bilobata]|uniref:NAD-dependent epimerase/dehydratase domain-containing protein n=1 Tax=Elliptochloris bilobata TaxID=381761 RepID=A0AAW1RZZ1_9CHLO
MDLRKPLYDIEREAKPSLVCVTGGTGYIAGAIVRRLLASGHSVRITCRDPGNEARLRYLRSLPGADRRLEVYKADLEHVGSFDTPVTGCDYVIHTASPVIMRPPKGKEVELVIRPAVAGVENVLASVAKSGSVRRVVMTSSVAAVVGDHWERGRHHVFTEADWNLTAAETHLPYHRSKLLAEKRAYELCAEQDQWTLITIQPPVVQGPPPGNVKCEVVGFMRKLLNGGYYPWAPPSGAGYVDIDDVAAAHTLAMVTPSAQGRYIVSARSMTLGHYVDLLRPEYSKYKLPFLPLPLWVIWLNSLLFGGPVDLALLRAVHGKVPHFDCSKAKRELGLTFMDTRRTAQDMAAALLELGLVRRLPGAPVGSFYLALAKL